MAVHIIMFFNQKVSIESQKHVSVDSFLGNSQVLLLPMQPKESGLSKCCGNFLKAKLQNLLGVRK